MNHEQQDPHNLQPEEPRQDLPPPDQTPPAQVATRLKRFAASLIDDFIRILVSIPAFSYFGVWESFKANLEPSSSAVFAISIYSLVMFFFLNGYLLYHYGQTIGKRVVGLAIVTLDDQRPAFIPLILNRYLPQWVAGFVPLIGPWLVLSEVAYIFFNDQNRCLHDLIAGTKVVDLNSQAQGLVRMEV